MSLGFVSVRKAGELFFHKPLSLEKALEIWQEGGKLKIHSCTGCSKKLNSKHVKYHITLHT